MEYPWSIHEVSMHLLTRKEQCFSTKTWQNERANNCLWYRESSNDPASLFVITGNVVAICTIFTETAGTHQELLCFCRRYITISPGSFSTCVSICVVSEGAVKVFAGIRFKSDEIFIQQIWELKVSNTCGTRVRRKRRLIAAIQLAKKIIPFSLYFKKNFFLIHKI